MFRPRAAFGAAFSLASLALLLTGCGSGQPPAPPPPAVTVANPVRQEVIDRDEYVGRFVAIESVEIRARVSGYLDKIHFTDGQIVKAGDLLFSIDPRPFQAALAQARADLARAKSQADLASADLARAETLIQQKTIAEALYDQRLSAKRAADAALQAAEANVKNAELNLEFTELRSPVSGRIGDRRVSPGNLVSGGTAGSTTLLATIVSTDPIRFEFTLDEASYLRYQRIAAAAGTTAYSSKIGVELRLLDEKEYKHQGQLDFLDNAIDTTSGTIRGRAQFANPDGLFTPGMFARIRVPGSPKYEALMVPDSAIGTEQVRKFLFTVDPDGTVKQKYVEIGALHGTLRVVRSGLEQSDLIIVNGLMRARPGAKVTPQKEGEQPAPPPAGQKK